ncbi:MAG TPA: hypothetical protein DCO77_04065 [Nitrospiraceae bacterium]|nr:hypothetical protein [Nitrospiraceae bacterium]
MIELTFSGTSLKIDTEEIVLPYSVVDAFVSKGIIVVLLDPDANLEKDKQYKNLLAYDPSGKKMWEAELPTPKPSDVYWKIVKKDPLVAYSFSSYECEIDLCSGKIIRSDFYK